MPPGHLEVGAMLYKLTAIYPLKWQWLYRSFSPQLTYRWQLTMESVTLCLLNPSRIQVFKVSKISKKGKLALQIEGQIYTRESVPRQVTPMFSLED